MYRLTLILVIALLCAATVTSAQVIDDFESGDISAWNAQAPYYAAVNLVSPGAGASAHALAIQEAANDAGVHSANALAHRMFTTPANWSAYVTLQMDAQISSGEWNGYSIRVYNAGKSTTLRGIHSDSSTPGFRTISFDISGINRDQITELVIYVNRTSQNAGQTLTLDNIRLSATPVQLDSAEVLEDFSSADLTRWSSPVSAPYNTTLTLVDENAPTDSSTTLKALNAKLSTGSQSVNSLFRWRPVQTMDWSDYSTLEFDAKLTAGSATDGFSIRLYNQGNPQSNGATLGSSVRLRKFVPGTDYVTCQVDVSDIERDQISELLFYVNRTGANAAQAVRIDNIRLTRTSMEPTPDVLSLDTFDTYTGDPAPWDAAYNTTKSLNSLDWLTAPNAFDVTLTGTSTAAYVRRSWIVGGGHTLDLGGYKSLIFDAKVLKGTAPQQSAPLGFVANPNTSPADYCIPFYPSSYDTWQAFTLDISSAELDQLKWLRFYVNRCGVSDIGQILRLDNIRVSKQIAPPPVPTNPLVEDFETDGFGSWWYKHACVNELVTDPITNSKVLKITNGGFESGTTNWSNSNASAYNRKTLHANWSQYKTLEFDARVANSNTSQGFSARLRDFSNYQAEHPFYPTNEWKTFRFDISGETKSEVTALLFYVNEQNSNGKSQNGAQELYIDNIRLTNTPVQTVFTSIGSLKSMGDGVVVTIDGTVSTGQFASAVPDKSNWQIMRTVFFIEDNDRNSAIPVVIGGGVSGVSEVPAGTKVKVTGLLTTGFGTRYIYASSITPEGTGLPVPAPIGCTNKACGAPGRGLDQGVIGFSGVDTTGMLTTVWGKVLAVGYDMLTMRYWLLIDDGSSVDAGNGQVGLKVYDFTGNYASSDNVGRYLRATGFVMGEPETDSTGGYTNKTIRTLWLKQDLAEPIYWLGQ